MTPPTPDRMVALWDEMKRWPPEYAMNFSLCLANLAMAELGTNSVDAGIYDSVRGSDVYLVAGTGPMEPKLRAAVQEVVGGRGFTVKQGDRETPMSGGPR